MQRFIRERYGRDWLVWSHEPEDPELEDSSDDEHEHAGGGFTLKRKLL
jgi:hypothetical protein